MNPNILLIFAISTSSFSQGFCGNVLVLCPMCTRSHKNVIVATVEGLAKRNHSITIVSSYKTSAESPNIRDIVVMDGWDVFYGHNLLKIRQLGLLSAFRELSNLNGIFLDGCHTTYQNPDFLKLSDDVFDLVITDVFCNQCLLGFAHKVKASVIISSPLPVPPAFAIKIGNYLPPSFVPDPFLPFEQEMNLLERTLNFVIPKISYPFYFSWYDEHEKIYRQYLGEDTPGLAELESDISMMLVNSHFSINDPRPTMPDVVEIGGVQCRSGRPLPKDLEDFVSGSKNGIIVFSLGSVFSSRDMPEETRKAFVNAFSRLNQRVLWKWDYPEMDDLPSNVMLAKWLPLQDVLAHPKTKLFITHGGLLSTHEAIYHGVPMVGIPLFVDQDLNVQRLVRLGIAVFVEIIGMQEKDVSEAIETVLKNPEYKDKVGELSTVFRDRPVSAVDTAVFWAEYVMRHNGAPQLRSAARKLSFLQYHSFDVILILFTILVAVLSVLFAVARKMHRKIFGSNSTTDLKKKGD